MLNEMPDRAARANAEPLSRQIQAKMRVAVIADFLEEQWPSMDCVAESLANCLAADARGTLSAELVRPRFIGLSLSQVTHSVGAFTGVRLFNRFAVYPSWIARNRDRFDLFHITDHSYSHLINHLPENRCIVTCHDLDTFKCMLEPHLEPRSTAFRAMTGRILDGFRRAHRVICVSSSTRDQILHYSLVPPNRLAVIQNGVAPAFSPAPDPESDAQIAAMLERRADGGIEILQVGSAIKRKRIDLLLEIFAALRSRLPGVHLIRAGGPMSNELRARAEQLGVAGAIIELPMLKRRVLAAAYRRATCVLLPSDSEGFGLPVLEAMACGTPVIVSDLAVLREVGGGAAYYCPIGDIDAWVETILRVAAQSAERGQLASDQRKRLIEQASKFSWTENAARTADIYREMLSASSLQT
jgi:glycosyltransferase involved in cell wall biosynthesis